MDSLDHEVTYFILGELGCVKPPQVESHTHPEAPVPRSLPAMSGDSTNVVYMVDWGNRLSLALYDFSTINPSAAKDLIVVAKQVTLLANVLRQSGTSLKAELTIPSAQATQTGPTLRTELTIPSAEAIQTLQDVLRQCQRIFREIEVLVPVWERSGERGLGRGLGIDARGEWTCDELTVQKLKYLLGMLEGLQLTLSVLLQTVYTAKTIVWAKQAPSQPVFDPIRPERMQLESLVVEQQLAIIHCHRLHQHYTHQRAMSTQAPTLALVQTEQRSPSPQTLVLYQESSLVQAEPASSEMEDLVRVRRIAPSYTEFLLSRWTRLQDREQRLAIGATNRPIPKLLPPPMDGRRRSQQPTVESDDEDGGRVSQSQSPSLGVNSPGPVLMHKDDSDEDYLFPSAVSSTPGSPYTNSRPPEMRAHRSYSSTLPANPFIQPIPPGQPPPPRRASQYSSADSPQRSPRASFGSVASEFAPRGPQRYAVKPAAPGSASIDEEEEEGDMLGIPWCLRVRDKYWHYVDSKIKRTNCTGPPTPEDRKDRDATTEISERWVNRRALEENGHRFTAVAKDAGNGRKTVLETCYCIHRGLAFSSIEHLVQRSVQIYRSELDRPVRRNSRGSQRIPLDRSQTAPNLHPLKIPQPQGSNNSGQTPRSPRQPIEIHYPPHHQQQQQQQQQQRSYAPPPQPPSHYPPPRPSRHQSDRPPPPAVGGGPPGHRTPLSSSLESDAEAERRMRMQSSTTTSSSNAPRSRRDSKSHPGGEMPKDEKLRGGGRSRSSRRGSMSKGSLGSAILGGAGLLTLLEGLPDALGAL